MAQSPTVRIILDAMGGDFAPQNEVLGAIAAMEHFKTNNINAEVAFVGREKDIRSALAQHGASGADFPIIHADDVVTMEDEPAVAFRKKRGSSLYIGLQQHAEGYAQAFVSAGNTGAVM